MSEARLRVGVRATVRVRFREGAVLSGRKIGTRIRVMNWAILIGG